jgi:hypothetical protein
MKFYFLHMKSNEVGTTLKHPETINGNVKNLSKSWSEHKIMQLCAPIHSIYDKGGISKDLEVFDIFLFYTQEEISKP